MEWGLCRICRKVGLIVMVIEAVRQFKKMLFFVKNGESKMITLRRFVGLKPF